MTDEIQMPGWTGRFLAYSSRPYKTPLGLFSDDQRLAERDGWTLVFRSVIGGPALQVIQCNSPGPLDESHADAELALLMQAATGRRKRRAKMALRLLAYAETTP